MTQSIQAQPDTQANSEQSFSVSGYLKIPNSIRHELAKHYKQHPLAYLLFSELMALTSAYGGTATVKKQTLGEKLGGISKRHIGEELSWLEAQGWLTIKRTRHASHYRLGLTALAHIAAETARQEALEARKEAAKAELTDQKESPEFVAQLEAESSERNSSSPLERNSSSRLNTKLKIPTNKADSQKQTASSQPAFVAELVKELNEKLPQGQPKLALNSLKAEVVEAFQRLSATHTAPQAQQQLLQLALGANAQKVAGWLNSPAGIAAAEQIVSGIQTAIDTAAAKAKERELREKQQLAERAKAEKELERARAARETPEIKALLAEAKKQLGLKQTA